MAAIYSGNLMGVDQATGLPVDIRPGIYDVGQPVPDDAVIGFTKLRPSYPKWLPWAALSFGAYLLFGGKKK